MFKMQTDQLVTAGPMHYVKQLLMQEFFEGVAEATTLMNLWRRLHSSGAKTHKNAVNKPARV